MDKTKIMEAFADMAGLNSEEVLKYSSLAILAASQVEAQCKSDVVPSKEPVLVMLCAALVNLWANLASASNDPSGRFSGNGYSITKNSKSQMQTAQALFDRWRIEAAGLLVDEGFAFFASKEIPNEPKK
ncbi:MAG: hypothetical protein K2I60_01595 [Oscillospiraceae bacterium]|nr:hypothetical protein [Oscillospiraceae bacterium]MDE5852975.1 hypothetical protein [Oscillospiraceae bacterium]